MARSGRGRASWIGVALSSGLLAGQAFAAASEVARLAPPSGIEASGPAAFSRDQRTIALRASDGSVLVFERPADGWSGDVAPSARLAPADGSRLEAVALDDGVVLAGSFRPGEEGAAFVFVEPDGGWDGAQTETAKLVASDDEGESGFGLDVALEDGVAVVSAPDAETAPGANGAAYVFLEPRRGWSGTLREHAKLRPEKPQRTRDEDGSFFRLVEILHGTVFATAELEGAHHGAVYVFEAPAAGWKGEVFEVARLVSSDSQIEDHFGDQIAVHGDTLVVGAEGLERDEDPPVYVFVEPAGGWANALHEQATLVGDPSFGTSLAFDRDTVLVRDAAGALEATLRPPGGFTGAVPGPMPLLAGALPGALALRGDLAVVGPRVVALGLDADADGLTDALEASLGSDEADADSDADGLADGVDPGFVRTAVRALRVEDFHSRGNRRALLVALTNLERRIARGDPAPDDLARIQGHLDGCEPEADGNDWIVACDAQREIRRLLEVLEENLTR